MMRDVLTVLPGAVALLVAVLVWLELVAAVAEAVTR